VRLVCEDDDDDELFLGSSQEGKSPLCLFPNGEGKDVEEEALENCGRKRHLMKWTKELRHRRTMHAGGGTTSSNSKQGFASRGKVAPLGSSR